MVECKFVELSNIWKSMPRNNAYEIKAADCFYNDNIMPLSMQKFLDNYAEEAGIYELMFVTVGTSWQPVALSILAKQPKIVVFMATIDVEQEIAEALDFMAKQNYNLQNYEVKIVDKAHSEDIINCIKNAYTRYSPNKVCIDITGGTKAMVAAAAMISADLDIDIFYVESNYLPVFRHPEPGSERLVKLARPQDLE